MRLNSADIPDFERACAFERVFGAKALSTLRAYGLDDPAARFFLLREGGEPAAALCLADGVLLLSAAAECDLAPVAELARREGVSEIDTTRDHARTLQSMLGGELETSWFMEYRGAPPEGPLPALTAGNPPAVFDILQRSHEYYRTHLRFEPWSADLLRRSARGLLEVFQLELDGEPVATGSLLAEDGECAVIGSVAVVPEHRHKGYASQISRFLVRRCLQKGKTPRLVAGYDAVAELYRKIGFTECGFWGELYL